jgi:alcohol dehydrogenase class IV
MDYRANWNYPTSIRFGVGRIKELAQEAKNLGMKRALLVTDPGLASSDIIREALSNVSSEGLDLKIFSEFKGNPVGKNVNDGVEAYKAGGHDGVIAFGGGSALDVGKAIAFMSGQSRPLWDFEDVGDNFLRADTTKLPAVIAVPTTAGTGSEVGRASVITNDETHRKVIIFHPRMLPNLVISDPELTVGLPPHLTAATGMDALAHALEAFSSPFYHPMAGGIGVEAIRLIKEWLPKAVKDGKDIDARANMLAAASMGAAAFQKGLGAIHSLSHPLGAVYDKHHGLLNAIVMPYVLRFNRSAIEERIIALAGYLGLDRTFEAVEEWIVNLRKEIGIPSTLADIGVQDERLDELSQMAFEDPSTPTNPVPLTPENLKRLFQASLSGNLSGL